MSSVLLILALPGGEQWWGAFVGLVPLLFAVEGLPLGWAFLLGWLTGTLWALWMAVWLLFLAFSGFAFSALMSVGLIAGYLLLSLYLGAYFGLFILHFRFVARRNFLWAIVLSPFLWSVLEYTRGKVLTGFPWAYLSHSLYRKETLIQVASIGGAYLVSYLLVFMNTSLFALLKARRWPALFGTAVVLWVFSLLYSALSPPASSGPGPVVSIVQANIPQDIKNTLTTEVRMDIFDRHLSMTREVLSRARPEIVFWSESMVISFLNTNRGLAPYFRERISELCKKEKVSIFLGSLASEGGSSRNSCYFFTQEGKVAGRYDKIHLVPFGEYVPLGRLLPFLGQVVPYEGGFTPGDRLASFRFRQYGFCSVICYEDTFPSLCRKLLLRTKGERFLVNITNDGWFASSWELEQHLASSVFRAVEFRVGVVRAANTGISTIIDPYGSIEAELPKNSEGTITGVVQVNSVPSLYLRFGDLFVLLSVIILGGGTLLVGRYAQRSASK